MSRWVPEVAAQSHIVHHWPLCTLFLHENTVWYQYGRSCSNAPHESFIASACVLFIVPVFDNRLLVRSFYGKHRHKLHCRFSDSHHWDSHWLAAHLIGKGHYSALARYNRRTIFWIGVLLKICFHVIRTMDRVWRRGRSGRG